MFAQAVRPRFFNYRAASDYTSLSERTLQRLVSDGRLACRRIGRRVVIEQDALDQLLGIRDDQGEGEDEASATTN